MAWRSIACGIKPVEGGKIVHDGFALGSEREHKRGEL